MLLSNAAIKNRTTVLVLVILIIFAGATSYVTLPRESTPDIKIPNIMITTVNASVSPEDIESTITNEIESKLTGLKGMKEITSSSAEGISSINVEFHSDVDIDEALQRVRDKVDLAKPELPKDADEPVEPVITEINLAEMPIIRISMSGPISPVRMKTIAEALEDEMEAVPGVLEVNVLGTREREIIIEIDPDRVAMYGLSNMELTRLIPSENVNQTAGSLETEGMKFNVRVPAEFDKIEEINKLPLVMRDGKPIYLSDVARVLDTFKDRETFSRLDGQTSVTIEVKKRIGANIIHIADHIKAILEEAEKVVPKGVKFELITDRSKEIKMMILDLENNIFTGLVLVVLVLVLFMGLRSSLIVATVIPLSMLMSFAILQVMGVTLNMVVLFSLILALGMLVDNAIVIVENIYRYMEMGFPKIEAAMKGTGEVAWPVVASTATTVAAFCPLMFWPGIMGDFMKFLPLTVVIVLISSLFVALVINPVICSLFGKPLKTKDNGNGQESRLVRVYRHLLEIVLGHPITTICLAFIVLVSISLVYGKRGAGVEFFPDIDPAEATVNIRAPQGTNIAETDRLARLIEERIDPFRLGPNGEKYIDNVVTNVGGGNGDDFGGGGVGGTHNANVTIIFPDFEDRVKPARDIIVEIREAVADIAGAEIKVAKQKEGPPTGAPVTIRVIGKDTKVLKALSEEIKKTIQSVSGLVNLRSDLEAEKPELVFVPDRKRVAMYNVNTATISNFLKTSIFGTKVSSYREFNDEYDIRIRLPFEDRQKFNRIKQLRVPSAAGQAAPISSLGQFHYKPGLGTIHRINRKRVVTVTGDNEGRLGPDVFKDAKDRLENFTLPAGYRIEYAGEKEEQDEASQFLAKAFAIAILLIIGILVTQFNTISVPFIIMTTVVLSLIGVFVGLLVCNMPFGIIMTGVGVISLAGVVVNNAIVLLDYTRQLQRRGRNLVEAAVEAGVTRLRPVLLTAGTTILSLIPMATGVSFDFHTFTWSLRSETSQWWASMAIAVIFGLGFATLLTLLVVPSLYVLLYRVAQKFGMGGLSRPEDPDQVKAHPVLEDY